MPNQHSLLRLLIGIVCLALITNTGSLVHAISPYESWICDYQTKDKCILTLTIQKDESFMRADHFDRDCNHAGLVDGMKWNRWSEFHTTGGFVPNTTVRVLPSYSLTTASRHIERSSKTTSSSGQTAIGRP
ncbi:hypothetical protein B0H63DRAFT_522864 [Podospora didyma]|uniref:Cyanovirin-N domain-containing protein n=1 Tax=Podospora didyma TaxID=330526 RepID=A0AAE0NQ09_9PEZI|nr:hypothetical protein B0H63DRAFT_522864 [Podospora didyma]